jgi:hypothetical protein
MRGATGVMLFAFLCVLERRTSFLLSTTLILSVSVSVLTFGNRRNGRRSEEEHLP